MQRSELPERHSAPECSAACRYAAVTAAYPLLRLRVVSPETELDSTALRRRAAALKSAALRRAGSALPKVLVLRPLAVWRAAALESALLQAGRAAPEAIVWRPAAVREMARSSAEFAVRARRLAGPVVSAAQAALPLEERAEWDAVEAPQQVAVARDAAAVPLRGAVLRAVQDVRVAEPRAARPSAVLWVFRRDQALPWPAPQPAERFARAMQCLRIALP